MAFQVIVYLYPGCHATPGPNCQPGDPAGCRKFDKLKSTGRIDGLVALAMALNGATGAKPKEAKAAGLFDWNAFMGGRA